MFHGRGRPCHRVKTRRVAVAGTATPSRGIHAASQRGTGNAERRNRQRRSPPWKTALRGQLRGGGGGTRRSEQVLEGPVGLFPGNT